MTVTNDGGSNTKTITKDITITAAATPTPTPSPIPTPIAGFSGTPTSGNAPLAVTFTDSSTGTSITSWAWTFGDGGTSTSKNPAAHTYANPGTYTVSHTATNAGGSNTKTIVGYIIVHNATPTAKFNTNVTSGFVPLGVQFTDTSTGNNIYSWSWDFGDTTSSTSQNAVHVYSTAGTYTANLTVTNDGGSSSTTKTITVKNIPPVAKFTATPVTGNTPLTVQFTDQSTGININTWLWNFGDGQTSPLQSPSHQYTSPGAYTVILTASNDGGSNTTQKVSYINVIQNSAPVTNFAGTPTSGSEPLTVTFTDSSTGNNIYGWLWDFGDGNTSTLQNPPAHTYYNAGSYNVKLTATNDGGSTPLQKTNYITVVHNAPPVASFTGTPTDGNKPLTVAFTDTSTGKNIGSWYWDFGDYTYSTQRNPTHTYTDVGSYTVKLTVTNDGGPNTAQYADYITVNTGSSTIIPQLAGALANIMHMIVPVPSVNADSYVNMTPPAGTALDLTTVDSTTMQAINNSILSLGSKGGTNIGAGIAQAIDEFNSPNYINNNRKFIILLTDGYSQYPAYDIAEAQQAANQGITIYTIGMGMPDDATLTTIANMTGGNYTKVTSLQQLVNTYSAIANNQTDIAGSDYKPVYVHRLLGQHMGRIRHISRTSARLTCLARCRMIAEPNIIRSCNTQPQLGKPRVSPI